MTVVVTVLIVYVNIRVSVGEHTGSLKNIDRVDILLHHHRQTSREGRKRIGRGIDTVVVIVPWRG